MGDYLFADPSTLSGVARSLDLGGVFDDYNYSRTPEEADAKSMLADWLAVGRDLSDAIQSYAEEE